MLSRRTCLYIASALLGTLALLVVLACSPLGIRLAVDWINRNSNRTVSLEGVSGSLLSTIHIDHLKLDNPYTVVEGQNITLETDWSDWQEGTVHFHLASIADLTAKTNPKRTQKVADVFIPRLWQHTAIRGKTLSQWTNHLIMNLWQINATHGHGDFNWNIGESHFDAQIEWKVDDHPWRFTLATQDDNMDIRVRGEVHRQPIDLHFLGNRSAGYFKNLSPLHKHRVEMHYKHDADHHLLGHVTIAPWLGQQPPDNRLNLDVGWLSAGKQIQVQAKEISAHVDGKDFKGHILIKRDSKSSHADIKLVGKHDHFILFLDRGVHKALKLSLMLDDLSRWSGDHKGYLSLGLNYVHNREEKPRVQANLSMHNIDIFDIKLASAKLLLEADFSAHNQIEAHLQAKEFRFGALSFDTLQLNVSPGEEGAELKSQLESAGLSCLSHWLINIDGDALTLYLDDLRIVGFEQAKLVKPSTIRIQQGHIQGDPICLHYPGDSQLCATVGWESGKPWQLGLTMKHWHTDQLILLKQIIGLTLLDGFLDGQLTLSSMNWHPHISGDFTIDGFNIIHTTGYQMSGEHFHMALTPDEKHPDITRYQANLIQKEGSLNIDGILQFTPDFNFTAHMVGKNVAMQFITSGTSLWVNPDVQYKLSSSLSHLTGNVGVQRGTVDLTMATSVYHLPVEVKVRRSAVNQRFDMEISMDLALKTLNPIDLQASYMSAKLFGSLRLIKPPRDGTVAEGQLSITDADLKDYNDIVHLKQASLYYNDTDLDAPQIYFKLEKTVYDFNFSTTAPTIVGIEVRGSLDNYNVSFYSYPDTLPTSQIVSKLFMGAQSDPTDSRDTSDDTEASLMTTMIKHGLQGTPLGNEGPLGRLAQSLSVNELSLDPAFEDDTSGESLYDTYVVVGKQLLKKLYLRYRYGITHADNLVYLIYRLATSWRLEGYHANTYNDGDSFGVNLLYNFN